MKTNQLESSLAQIGVERHSGDAFRIPSGKVVLNGGEELRFVSVDGGRVNNLEFNYPGANPGYPLFELNGKGSVFCSANARQGSSCGTVFLTFPAHDFSGDSLIFATNHSNWKLSFNKGVASLETSIVLGRSPQLLPVLQAHVDRLREVKNLMNTGKLPFEFDPRIKQFLDTLPEEPLTAGDASMQQILQTMTSGERRAIQRTVKILAGFGNVLGEDNPFAAQVEGAKKLLGQIAAVPNEKHLPSTTCSTASNVKKQRHV